MKTSSRLPCSLPEQDGAARSLHEGWGCVLGFPRGSAVKNPPAVQETGVQSLSREDSREGRGNPIQSSCLENPMDRGAWWATVYGVAESDTKVQLETDGGSMCPGVGLGVS